MFIMIYMTRKVGRPPAAQFSSTYGELVAFGSVEQLSTAAM